MKMRRVKIMKLTMITVLFAACVIVVIYAFTEINSENRSDSDCAKILEEFNERAKQDPLNELTKPVVDCAETTN